jgi:hypothetical protein
MNTYTVTCRTEDCPNKDIGIDVVKPADGDVVCGPCRQPITDVVAK